MKYKLSTRFQKEFKAVVDYIYEEFGKQSALEFAENAQRKLLWVIDNPTIGRIEPLLQNHQTELRSIIIGKHNKAIYYIEGDTLFVTDLWDMRMEPTSLARRIRKR